LEQVATELGIVLCLRRKPSDGGIVERPFGSLNTQFFSSLPIRDDSIAKLQRQKKKKQNADAIKPTTISETDMPNLEECIRESKIPFVSFPVEPIIETAQPKKPVPYVRVYDYEELKRQGGLW